MNFKTILLLICLVSAVSTATGETYRVYATNASREVYGCSGRLIEETSGQGILVGYPEDASCGSIYSQSNAIWAFRMPIIPEGKILQSAAFNVYYIQHYEKSGVVRYGPTESLYAIPFRPGTLTNPVAAADHFVGAYEADTTDCFAIQQNFSGDLTIHPVWKTTDVSGSQRLRSFLQTQLYNGVQPNDWILLRQNCEYVGTVTTREHFGDSYYSGGQYLPFIEYELIDEGAANLSPEITPGLMSVNAPIHHQPYYLHERELFGYHPRFELNSATFGPGNKPYIRGETSVQTLNDQGLWVKYDFAAMLKSVYPSWDGVFTTYSSASEDRIVFDSDEDAYLIVNLNIIGYVLMYSHDLCQTWQCYALGPDVLDLRMEFNDTWNDCTRPPPILARTPRPTGGANYIQIITPIKNANGTLTIPSPVRVTGISIVGGGLNAGKGASNLTITKGNKTHIVFAGRYFEGEDRGTPQYITTFDHITRTVTPPITSPPIYLGSAGDPLAAEPDGHNWPAITIDSSGILHVILSAHGKMNGQCFKYRRSLVANSAVDGWSATANLATGLTYPSLLCDASNTLHLVARDYWEPEMRLKHQKAPYSGGTWTWGPRQVLVIPWDAQTYSRAPYSHYAAKFNIDRSGRFYVVYWNDRNLNIGTDEFNQLQLDAFNAKYPFDGGVDNLWHDPAMLTSSDGTQSWHLAVTEDFINGFEN